MVKVKEDLTGIKFGRWKVLEQADDYVKPNGCHTAQWFCECECGTKKNVLQQNLKNGSSISCGCFVKEQKSIQNKKYNIYDLSREYGIGYTSKGEEFYFDLEDYDKIKDYCWYINSHGYLMARRLNIKNTSKQLTILFHRIIFNEPDKIIDHKNHNRLDNRKSNLRLCTIQQNCMNKSNVKGITYHKRDKKWQATIGYHNKHIHLGYYSSKKAAIEARKRAEEKYFGEYSYDKSIKANNKND